MRNAKEIFEKELSGEPLYQEAIIEIIKQVQIETIRETVKVCADNAEADVYFKGWLAEESLKSGESFEEGEDYEVYVIKSSILEVADKLIKELE